MIHDKWKPAVSQKTMILLAGLVWLCVGIMLMRLAFIWLFMIPEINIFIYLGPGVLLGLLIRHFGFSKIVVKNLKRIRGMNEKNWVFAFIPWTSYLIILIMINLGRFLRHSGFPKEYLAIMYSGIGLALALSSLRYFMAYYSEIKNKN